MKDPAKPIIATGLALGGVFGMAGTVVSAPNLRAVFWAIDSVGLIVATAMLALRRFRSGDDLIAAGFLVFAIGEAVIFSGTASTLDASAPAFAAGSALWSAALLLTSIPPGFGKAFRMTGVVAAVLFAIAAARVFWGEPLNPLSSPLPFFAYPFLVLTFAGWVLKLLKD